MPIPITLIVGLTECRKCRECEAMLGRLQERYPGQLVVCTVPADDPRAEQYGVVMPPMVIVDDFVVSAGRVPPESALERLLGSRLVKEADA